MKWGRLAILGGTIGAGVLMASDAYAEWVALSVVLIALVGTGQSRDSRRDGRLANPYGLARAAPVVADSAAGFGQQRAVSRHAGQFLVLVSVLPTLTQIPAFSKRLPGWR